MAVSSNWAGMTGTYGPPGTYGPGARYLATVSSSGTQK